VPTDYTLVAINNNSPGAMTFGSGTNGITGILTNASGATFTFAGTTTLSVAATVGNTGTLNAGGTTTFGLAVTNNATGIYNGGTCTCTFTGAVSNAGTFNGSTVIDDFNNVANSFTNTNIVNYTGGATTIVGAFTNTSPGTFIATAGSITFDGAAQAISNSTVATPVAFFNVTFAGTLAKTLSGAGSFNVASLGSLTMGAGTVTLATGGKLTLKSDANGSARVATITTTNPISGNVNVERYISGGSGYSRGYRLLSSPVGITSGGVLPNLSYLISSAYLTGTGGATNGFDVVGNPTLYFYRENLVTNTSSFTSGNYRGVGKINNGTASQFTIDVDNGPFTLPAGNGFLFFFRGDRALNASTNTTATAMPVALTSIGVLNQGSITVSHWYGVATAGKLLWTNATANTNVRGYNLVGNPYASSVDWDLVTHTNLVGGTNAAMYIYNPTLKTYAVYASGNNGIGTNFNGPSGTADIIPSGQGFFVRATASNTGVVTFDETDKVANQVSTTTLSLATTNTVTNLRYLRLQVFKDSLNREEALVFFKDTAKTKYSVDEDIDYLRGNNTVGISTRSSDNVNLAINQTNFSQIRQTIPINVNISTTGTYQLNLSEIKNIPPTFDIWLLDKFRNDSLDFKANPSYSFTATPTDTASFGANRFKLIVRANGLLAVHLLSFTGTKNPTSVSLNWTTENEGDYTTFVLQRSINGGSTYTTLDSLKSANFGSYTDLDPTPVIGENRYRLKMIDISGNVTYSTVVIVMYSTPTTTPDNTIVVYPNPVHFVLALLIKPANNKGGNYKITITNNSGIVVKTGTTNLPVWLQDVVGLLPGTYFINVTNTKDPSFLGRTSFIKL
jgi:hypothetical protein